MQAPLQRKEVEDRTPLWRVLSEVAQGIGRTGAENLRSEGITFPQFVLLQHLRERPAANQQDLAERMRVTKGNVSQMLKTMEREGWIHREAGKEGNRIRMTEPARSLLDRLAPLQSKLMRERFSCLSPEEFDRLHALLDKLRRSIP